mmetsp:Transcript_11172/g.16983  ORF Transcript_11172/g.16983 Transcript_11172/m.16983 type:complete len:426 (-) Transcript_11172:368-1645(-)|eukprot:CAMPEP_0196134786 /NCGR_PEP_ID=MMETSP0910-20130528/3608_1 /TAXON_ID=49265 /ORGANISM="Thalassiosira rotula, Strain GSO102" /LENGTH=425 /DNA_ID=CAMNT_0041394805 /DNA_START=269 /DNA_END=1546 /DNA_ORIENTATION=+
MIQSRSETDSNPSKRRWRGNNDISMDFSLQSEDLQLGPLRSKDILLNNDGIDATHIKDNAIMRLKSSDIVKEMLLPDTAMTAAATLEAKHHQLPISRSGEATLKQEKINGKLTPKLERRSTGDDLVSMNTTFRISSRDWIEEFKSESVNSSAIQPSLFLDSQSPSFKDRACDTAKATYSTSTLPLNYRPNRYEEYQVPLRSSKCKPSTISSLNSARVSSSDWVQDFRGEPADSGPIHPSLFVKSAYVAAMTEEVSSTPPPVNSHQTHVVSPQQPPSTLVPPMKYSIVVNSVPATTPITSSSTKRNTHPSVPTTCKKKKKNRNRKRMLDETRVVEPTDGDVLSGRGGYTNTHPGNIRFRKKALEFRPWYEESCKGKKQVIAELLVDFVKNDGHRFLGKGEDGLWHEVIGKGPHLKASQALRERIKD